MTDRPRRGSGLSAAELLARLAEDASFQRAQSDRDATRQRRTARLVEAQAPIVADLHDVGVDVESVWDLVNSSEPYPAALPVLMSHLERGSHPDRIQEGLARAMAVSPAAAYWHRLRALYLAADGPGAVEGLAVALAGSAEGEHLDDLLALLRDRSRGGSRIHLIDPVLRLGGVSGRRAVNALREDPVLGIEAARALDRHG